MRGSAEGLWTELSRQFSEAGEEIDYLMKGPLHPKVFTPDVANSILHGVFFDSERRGLRQVFKEASTVTRKESQELFEWILWKGGVEESVFVNPIELGENSILLSRRKASAALPSSDAATLYARLRNRALGDRVKSTRSVPLEEVVDLVAAEATRLRAKVAERLASTLIESTLSGLPLRDPTDPPPTLRNSTPFKDPEQECFRLSSFESPAPRALLPDAASLASTASSRFEAPPLFLAEMHRSERRNLVDPATTRRHVMCQVCSGQDSGGENPIVECERCLVQVHKCCYGLESLGSEEFICSVCLAFGEGGPSAPCIFCPLRGRVLKEITTDLPLERLQRRNLSYFRGGGPHSVSAGRARIWSHLSCLLWIPELSTRQTPAALLVWNLAKIPSEMFRFPCEFCGAAEGVVVRCSAENCQKVFHVECGRRGGAFLYVSKALKNEALCEEHNPTFPTHKLQANKERAVEEIDKFLKTLYRGAIRKGEIAILSPKNQPVSPHRPKRLPHKPRGELPPPIQSRGKRGRKPSGDLGEKVLRNKAKLDEVGTMVVASLKGEARERPEMLTRVFLSVRGEPRAYSIREIRENSPIFELFLSPSSPMVANVAASLGLTPLEVLRKYNQAQRIYKALQPPENRPSEVETKRSKVCNLCRKSKEVSLKFCCSCNKTFHVTCLRVRSEAKPDELVCKKCLAIGEGLKADEF